MSLSRRDLLGLLGLGGAGVTAACACSGLLAALLLRRRNDPEPEVRVITATPAAFPGMIPRAAWGAAPPNHNATFERGFYDEDDNPEGWRVYAGPLVDAYQTVVIHHSVIDNGDDIATLREIQETHRDDRGWADVGYHFFVGKSGRIYEGRALNVRGTHVGGFNTGSVGVCLLGDFTQATPDIAQVQGAETLINWLAERLALTHLAGHQDFNPGTQCPGTNLIPLLDDLAFSAGLQQGTDGYIAPS